MRRKSLMHPGNEINAVEDTAMKNPLYINTLKAKMKTRPVFGMTIYSNCPQLIECMAYAGFDFAFIDAEHCPWETTSLREAILAARAAGISPLVRVTQPDMVQIRKALEMGAEGVIIPHVRSVEDMRLCVKAAKFPPVGRRGFDTTVRAAQFGMGLDETELVIPMCEDFEFTDALEEMLSVEGIDAVNFGPADYSMSTNRPSGYDMKNTNTEEVLKQLVLAAKPRDIAIMAPALPTDRDTINSMIDKGVNMLICGSDIYHFQNVLNGIKAAGVGKYVDSKE